MHPSPRTNLLPTLDPTEQALQEIYTFYSRQHIKRGIEFDQHS